MRDGIRIAVAAVALCALPAAVANGQTTFRETGSVTVGSALVWVRGTNTGVVQLFVGRGFHDAFARPHEVNAAALARWIDSVRAIAPARDSAAAEAQVRASVLSPEVTMMRRSGGPFSGLRVLISGEDPIAMPEPTASDFLAVLDSAARVAEALSAPAPAPAPSRRSPWRLRQRRLQSRPRRWRRSRRRPRRSSRPRRSRRPSSCSPRPPHP